MIESTRAAQFLYTTLSGDATLQAVPIGGVFRGMAQVPTTGTVATPYIVFNQQSSVDVMVQNATRLWSNMTFQVVAVAPATQATLAQTAADRFDSILTKTYASGDDYEVMFTNRESAILLDELVNGKMWTRIGGIYRFLVRATS